MIQFTKVDLMVYGGQQIKQGMAVVNSKFLETNKGLEWFKDADEFGDLIINNIKVQQGHLFHGNI